MIHQVHVKDNPVILNLSKTSLHEPPQSASAVWSNPAFQELQSHPRTIQNSRDESNKKKHKGTQKVIKHGGGNKGKLTRNKKHITEN